MDLSILQRLPTDDKLLWLRTTAGLTTLEEWLSSGNSLRNIAKMMMDVDPKTLYRWYKRYPDIAEVVSPYTPVRATKVEPAVDLSRGQAYRIIVGLDRSSSIHRRGTILGCEYKTAEDVWQCPFIHNYFKSFGLNEADYLDSYLQEISHSGAYYLSNTFSIIYGTVNPRGLLKTLIPPQ